MPYLVAEVLDAARRGSRCSIRPFVFGRGPRPRPLAFALLVCLVLLIFGCFGCIQQNQGNNSSPAPQTPQPPQPTSHDLSSDASPNLTTNTTPTSSNSTSPAHASAPTPIQTNQASQTSQTDRLYPQDLVYVGAFRLPEGAGVASWQYGGSAATYYPAGDPSGPNDGYPGSIFATGHEWAQEISEVSIPIPLISPSKVPPNLNTATSIQPFSDVKDDMFGELEIPRCGLAYLPKQGGQTTDKIYCVWGQHMQEGDDGPSHCWFELDLSNPQLQGPWRIAGQAKYTTTGYLFEIPSDWASANLPTPSNLFLATGRYRDGGQGAYGPSLIAFGPWTQGNPPAPGTALENKPILLYSNAYDDPGQLHAMVNYSHADQWAGGAWLTTTGNDANSPGVRTAVIFVGIKALGKTWYGYSDGTIWPEDPPYPEARGDEERGWWADSFVARMLFYDPDDFAAVARGDMQTYEPQPYAILDFDDALFNVPAPGTLLAIHRAIGGIAYDRAHGVIYVFEPLGDKETEQPIVHVWKIQNELSK